MARQGRGTHAFVAILAAAALAGCITSEGSQNQAPRIGDVVTYRIENGDEISIELLRTTRGEMAGGRECSAVDIAVSGAETLGQGRGISRLCLDFSLASQITFEDVHPHTNGTQYVTYFNAWDQYMIALVCALVCDKLGAAPLSRETPSAYGGSVQYTLESLRESRARFTIVANEDARGSVRTFSNITYDLRANAWPTNFKMEKTTKVREGDDTFTTFSWRLRSIDAGSGEHLRIDGQRENIGAKETAAETTAWGDRPTEGSSPFEYPQGRALQKLGLERTYIEFRQEHPDAFLAAASYFVLRDAGEGQTELLWSLLWQDGKEALHARCHLLRSALPLPLGGPAPYEEEQCFDLRTLTAAAPNSRGLHATEAVTWEQAAGLWREAMGFPADLTEARWTTLSVPLTFDPPIGDNLYPAAQTLTLSYNEGTIDTLPYSPSWLVEEPPRQSRAIPTSSSIMDPTTGRFAVVISPVAPPDWVSVAG